MKIDNVERAADMVKKYKEIDGLIKRVDVPDDEDRYKKGMIELGVSDYGVCWKLPYNDILPLLEARKSHLKKKLIELGVEV
jgi:hypothetical protein